MFTNNDSAYGAARDLAAAGVEIAAVVDLRASPDGPATERAEAAGLPVLAGHAIIGTSGGKRVSQVRIARIGADGAGIEGAAETLDCDLLAVSGGWSPTVHLFSQSRGKIRFDADLGCFLPGAAAQPTHLAGACNGAFGLASCLATGFEAGARAAKDAGFAVDHRPRRVPEASDDGFLPARWTWLVPSDKPLGQGGKHFVDLQNDVTAADLKLALREGYRSVEHVKRYTTTGMGTDQGKTGNVNAIGIIAETQGRPISEVGVTTFRPPYTAVTFGVFAGRDVDDFLDATRRTPIHAWHARNGAAFEDVGQWKRPWYYPQGKETLHEAVNREAKAVRASLGVLDATTLGKIDIQGKDTAEFLNRIYTNAWSKLEIGKCRYGLMLGEDGMVMDDGVTARLGEHHFLMTTTTGNAAAVFGHMEEYLQTEWPGLEVRLTSVTEQYATVTLSGPNSRRLLAELTGDIELSGNALPHMGLAHGTVAGIPARVFRISFTGEMSYEVNVRASYGLALWQAVMTAGEKYNITPYGTEAMHVLRAEKGFVIVGQETDGSTTPLDLGMDWIVSKKKDFIGKRSLSRPDMLKPDRKQLGGLLTEHPAEVLHEGAQLVETVLAKPPMVMVGHVSSSYHSPNLERSFALALIKGGRDKKGQRVIAPLEGGKNVPCTITDPVFLDPEGERLHGCGLPETNRPRPPRSRGPRRRRPRRRRSRDDRAAASRHREFAPRPWKHRGPGRLRGRIRFRAADRGQRHRRQHERRRRRHHRALARPRRVVAGGARPRARGRSQARRKSARGVDRTLRRDHRGRRKPHLHPGLRPARARASAKRLPARPPPERFQAGACAQSILAKSGVTLHLFADESAAQAGAEGPVFDIYVLRSFAEYLWDWLEDAGGEYGVTIVT